MDILMSKAQESDGKRPVLIVYTVFEGIGNGEICFFAAEFLGGTNGRKMVDETRCRRAGGARGTESKRLLFTILGLQREAAVGI